MKEKFKSMISIGDAISALADEIRSIEEDHLNDISKSLHHVMNEEIETIQKFFTFINQADSLIDAKPVRIPVDPDKALMPIEEAVREENVRIVEKSPRIIETKIDKEFIESLKQSNYEIDYDGELRRDGIVIDSYSLFCEKVVRINNHAYRLAEIVLGFSGIFPNEGAFLTFKDEDRFNTKPGNLSYRYRGDGTKTSIGRHIPTSDIIEICKIIADVKGPVDEIYRICREKKIRVSKKTIYSIRSKQMHVKLSDRYFTVSKIKKGSREYIMDHQIVPVKDDNGYKSFSETKPGHSSYPFREVSSVIENKIKNRMRLSNDEKEILIKQFSNQLMSTDPVDIFNMMKDSKVDCTEKFIEDVVSGKINNIREVYLYEEPED